MGNVLNLILTHQPAPAVERMLAYWEYCVPRKSIVIAYGGKQAEFNSIEHEQKFFVADPRLRTRDHQREFQSYTQLFQDAARILDSDGERFQFVHFAEYDHLPLVPDLNARQIQLLNSEEADVMGFHLHRIDATNHPHFLYHSASGDLASYWKNISVRSEPDVILSMFGSGSFWRRESFRAVAKMDEPFPVYMEIYLPTLAHHLGYRVRDFTEQNRFVGVLTDESRHIAEARKRGAWTLHPVKSLQRANPAAILSPLKMKSNLEWKKWGEIDPLYAVATWEGKQRGSHEAWTDKEFYELGGTDWGQFEMQWQQYGMQPGHCLEIGCGAGRMTAHLAKSFDQVTAVDVSQHQLDYATTRIQTANVAFTLTDGISLPVPSGQVEAVFSVHVFQHFESHADALLVFNEIYRVLAKGGTLMIGLPMYKLPDSSLRSVFRPMITGFERLSDLKAAFNRRSILKGKWKPMMRRLRFEQAWLANALQELHFDRIEFRSFNAQVGGDLVDFVFATKDI